MEIHMNGTLQFPQNFFMQQFFCRTLNPTFWYQTSPCSFHVPRKNWKLLFWYQNNCSDPNYSMTWIKQVAVVVMSLKNFLRKSLMKHFYLFSILTYNAIAHVWCNIKMSPHFRINSRFFFKSSPTISHPPAQSRYEHRRTSGSVNK